MKDIYQEVTDRIITALETGNIPWHRPWAGVNDLAVSYATGKPYSLLNQLLLGEAGEYITFQNCKKLGGHVKKGSKARMVVFWKMVPIKDTDKDGNIITGPDGKPTYRTAPLLKYDQVFHIRECEGIKGKLPEPEMNKDIKPIERAEKVLHDYIGRSGVKLTLQMQNKAFYRPSDDLIVLPVMEQFKNAEGYYSTAFHEATHSTGHPSRFARITVNGVVAAFGSADYSKEELVAEIGSATILNRLGVETEGTFNNSAAYIQGWLKALRNDKKLIVSAAGRAEKAVAMIFGE